jgi:hypothetical protein
LVLLFIEGVSVVLPIGSRNTEPGVMKSASNLMLEWHAEGGLCSLAAECLAVLRTMQTISDWRQVVVVLLTLSDTSKI